MTLPKNHINIRRHSAKLPFIISVIRKIFTLSIPQFNKPVLFSIERFHGRQFVPARFFFECSEGCVLRKVSPDISKGQPVCSYRKNLGFRFSGACRSFWQYGAVFVERAYPLPSSCQSAV